MGIKVNKAKWILYRHINDYSLIKEIAVYVKEKGGNIGSENARYKMRDWLGSMDMYHTRHPKVRPLDTQHHKIRTLEYYMFGYDTGVYGSRKFMFSPLGNLFIQHINDDDKLTKIFTTMLFAIQFHHPCNKVDKSIQLYPFRLLFKLMTDMRLDYRLHFTEYAQFVASIKTISFSKYEKLIEDILEFRRLSSSEQISILQENDHYSVNCIYELKYTSKLLKDAGICSVSKGITIGRFYHPRQKWAKPSTPPTSRVITDGYIEIAPGMMDFIKKMLGQYSCFDTPVSFDDSENLTIDLIKNVYSFYPELLCQEINEVDELQRQLLELPRLIERYSNNPDNQAADLFEQVLEDGFNMFCDVEAKRIGGSGHTDIECLYLTIRKKFVVEAKSTAKKLTLVNTQRLKEHRDEVGGKYTIVITSRFVPAAKRDIRDTPVVLLAAHTFSEYLYNHLYHDVRDITYSDFDKIIESHLGEDISRYISDMTINKFAVNAV